MTSIAILVINFGALLFLTIHLSLTRTMGHWDGDTLIHVLIFTVVQAAVSTLGCLAAGILGAPGYARLGRQRRLARWIFLLPNMMSPILSVLCLLLVFKNFPFGFWGIILGHIFINGGLAVVWLGERWLEIEQRWEPVNSVLGGSHTFFFRRALLPLMRPQLLNTAGVIFSLCLASFAVPLVLGGGPRNSTLEVLIYERIFADADVASGLVLGLIQCLLQFTVFWIVLKPILLKTESSRIPWTKARISLWWAPTFLLCALSIAPIFTLAQVAAGAGLPGLLSGNLFFGSPIFAGILKTSASVSFVVAGITFILLCLLTTTGWKKAVSLAPTLSGVAVGLAGMMAFKIWKHHDFEELTASLTWGHLCVVFLPVLRLCMPALEPLRVRYDKAVQQLGTPLWLAFKRVYLKLGLKSYIAGAVLAGCWSMGEFSVSSIMSPTPATLPVYIQSLMASYRLEAAAAASLILLIMSVLSMTIFEVFLHGVG